MEEEKKLYTINEVSELVGISESEIIRVVMLKKLPAIRVGKAIRIKEEDLEELEDFRGPMGLTIERDLYFVQKPISECK